MAITLKQCTLNELDLLQAISIETFKDTFDEHNSEENMTAYLEAAYNLEKLKNEIQTPDSYFYLLYEHDELAGYCKLNMNEAQSESDNLHALEVERIYIKPAFKGKGYGKKIIQHAETLAQKYDKDKIWLGVWEHNYPAQAFYEKMGFERRGAHSFFMGDDEQVDYILGKKIKN